jgi:hypothetical protein
MTQVNQSGSIFQGEDKLISYGIAASDGSSQDQTGNTACWSLRDENISAISFCKISGGSGITIDGSLVQVKLNVEDTASLSGEYTTELKANASGCIVVLATGIFRILESSF